MLGIINAVAASTGAIARYVKDGLVMANRFLTPPKITHPSQGSAEFNGSSDYIKVDPLPMTTFDNFTYSAWVNFDTLSYQNILGFGSTSNALPVSLIEVQSDGKINFFHRNEAVQVGQALSIDTVTTNKWYFVTGTKEGTSFKLYIDGSLSNTGSGGVTNPTTLNTFNIGRLERTSNTNYVDGNLANVAIWNRALSSDEINSVMWKGYESLVESEKSGLQAWYSLDDITSPAANLANMEQLATDKDATIENKAAITAAVNALS